MKTPPPEQERLLPCPFCGVQLIQHTLYKSNWQHPLSIDSHCPLMGIVSTDSKQWNTRHTPSVEGGVKGLRTGQELMEDYYFQSGGKDRSWDFVGWLDSIQRESYLAGQKSSGEMVEKFSRLLREVRLLWETRGILHSKTSRRVFSDIDKLLSQLESKGEV